MALSPSSRRAIRLAIRASGYCHPVQDRLALRADLAKRIAANAVDGSVGLYRYGTDCDGTRYAHVSPVPAAVVAFEREVETIDRYADGPYGITIVRPDFSPQLED